MADRPSGGSVTFKSTEKLPGRVPRQGLIGRFIQDQDAERSLTIIDSVRTSSASARAAFRLAR
jgi:hypothetical protein